MMRMNPQTAELMERNPEVARILEDPETMQQAMRAATNPAVMREMMRNADLAMGRADVMPGGHAALTRMHNEIVDPLHSAMHSGPGGGNSTTSNYHLENTTGSAPNSAALPNPWGPPAAPTPTPPPVATPPQTLPSPATPAEASPPAGAL